jgi:5'(3')-deoxyribonucleotidase
MIVFLDVDGVLANFDKRAFEALGLPYSPDHPALQMWKWHEYFGLNSDELDSVCTVDFWSGVQWMPDGREILKVVEEAFGEDIYLLTAPMSNSGSATGKVLWVERHIPRYKKRVIITQAPKSLFAGPDRLLIDDKDENIAEFVAAGGQGILVPRSWNELRGWADKTLGVVRVSLEVM